MILAYIYGHALFLANTARAAANEILMLNPHINIKWHMLKRMPFFMPYNRRIVSLSFDSEYSVRLLTEDGL